MKILDFALSKLIVLSERIKERKASNRRVQLRRNSAPIVNKKNVELNETQCVLEIVPTPNNTKILGSNWLAGFKDNRFSEHGEDGIIAKIFEILKPENKWVCEFGAHDPEIISNTWRLINQEKWNAVLIEADDEYFLKLQNYYKSSSSVYCLHTKVSYEGEQILDNLLAKTPIPTDLDFMVIDIDGNDYHVWEAIQKYRAKVVMIEFNASIPTDVSYIQPRDLSVNQGNSLKAMVELGQQRGYKLVAVTAWNAFFIQEQYYSLFFENEPALDDMYVFPVKHPIWMRPFQLYDGTIMMAPWNSMLWHKIDLKPADYQVLPISYRTFNRELAAQNFILENNGKKVSVDLKCDNFKKMPANKIFQFAKNIYSRHGEDGIIEQLVAAVSPNHLYFVDVGAWDGITHSRSRNLAVTHHWNGLVIENDATVMNTLIDNYKLYRHVAICEEQISLENSLDSILHQYNVPRDLDLLLLNVYGMEHYLWETLLDYSPKIVAIQFNPTIPNDVKFVQAKDFSIHQGCSLRALYELAHHKGYELIGVTLETAFFVKRDFFYRLFEMLNIQYCNLDDIFDSVSMRFFQLYDGTIKLHGLDYLMWQGIQIDEDKIQAVPKALRKFHQYADMENKKFFYRV